MAYTLDKFLRLENRDDWYRIPEREKTNFPAALTKKIKYPFSVNRIIVRVGYYYEPFDMPENELFEKLINKVQLSSNRIFHEPGQKILNKNHTVTAEDLRESSYLSFPGFENSVSPISREIVTAVIFALSYRWKLTCRKMAYQIRGEWVDKMHAQSKKREDLYLRTLWYCDLHNNLYYHPHNSLEMAVKHVGRCNPGTVDSGYSYDSYEPEPPSFSHFSTHALLIGGTLLYNDFSSCFYIHPLDIHELENTF